MRSTLITLALLALTLAACSDPLGIAQAEQIRADAQVKTAQIQADAATEQAQIDASTARLRVGGWVFSAAIAAIVVVLVVTIGGLVHIQAQRDRLLADVAIRTAALPAPQQQQSLPPLRNPEPIIVQTPSASQQQPGHWLALRRPPPVLPLPTALALPERSESRTDRIVVIDG